ncbi:purine and uridine phosphorylase, partial [Caulochytrium protostelioides]
APRVVPVGDMLRARTLATHLDGPPAFEHTSKRGFHAITGTFRGVPVSIVAIGMGIGNMDMFVREVRATTSGPLRIVRFGSCGAVGQGHCGQIAVAAHGAVMLTRHYDAFLPAATRTSPDPSASTPASASASTPASASVSTAHVVTDKADAAATTAGSRVLCGGRYHHVICGLNATADTFYASQGRADPHFDDGNASLIAELRALEPAIETLEMENFMLFHLAACSAAADPASQIRAAACAMIFADRVNNAFIESAQVAILEKVGGLAVLEALCLHD